MIDDIIKKLEDYSKKTEQQIISYQEEMEIYDSIIKQTTSSIVSAFNLGIKDYMFLYLTVHIDKDIDYKRMDKYVTELIKIFDAMGQCSETEEFEEFLRRENKDDILFELFDNIDMEPDELYDIYKKGVDLHDLKKSIDAGEHDTKVVSTTPIGRKKTITKSRISSKLIWEHDEQLAQALSNMIEHSRLKYSELKKNIKLARRKLIFYEDLTKLLTNIKDNELWTYIPSKESFNDDKLRELFLRWVLQHNQECLEILKSNQIDAVDINRLSINKIFKKHNIDIEQYQIEINYTEQELEFILSFLDKINIKDTLTVLQIIKYTSIERIETIKEYVEKGIISKKILLDNPSIFAADSTKFVTICKNIDSLSQYIVLISGRYNVDSLLLKDPFIIRNNLEIIDSYGFGAYLKRCKEFGFLYDEATEYKIILLVELGLSSYLENDLSILTYPLCRLKRLKLCANIGEEYTTNLYQILDDNNFAVSDDDIDNYLYTIQPNSNDNTSISRQVLIDKLNNYDNDPYVYNIAGILVAKEKVKKYLENCSDMISSPDLDIVLTKGSYYDYYELLKLHSNLFNGYTK